MSVPPPRPPHRPHRGPLLLAVLAAAAVQAPAQDRSEAWRELRERLGRSEAPADDSRALLEAFIARHGSDEDGSTSVEVVSARLQLGALHLAAFDLPAAEAAFAAAEHSAPAAPLDLRASAVHGQAQTAELAGRDGRARDLYGRLVVDFAGTRYADFGRVALHRLDRPPAERPRVGRPAPEFGPVLDRGGSARRLTGFLGRPALLLFVDPTDPRGTAAMARLVQSARAAGLEDRSMITFAADRGEVALAALAKQPEFRMPIVPGEALFLSPPFLDYEIRSLPASVLIGPDGVIVARDLPPRRLRETLQALLRGV
jgi:hypothetical protein